LARHTRSEMFWFSALPKPRYEKQESQEVYAGSKFFLPELQSTGPSTVHKLPSKRLEGVRMSSQGRGELRLSGFAPGEADQRAASRWIDDLRASMVRTGERWPRTVAAASEAAGMPPWAAPTLPTQLEACSYWHDHGVRSTATVQLAPPDEDEEASMDGMPHHMALDYAYTLEGHLRSYQQEASRLETERDELRQKLHAMEERVKQLQQTRGPAGPV
jgi:hypothetical protein